MKVKVILRLGGIALAVILCLPARLAAQCASAPHGGIRANPNRPTVADPADISEYGVLEVEYGWNHAWRGGGFISNDFGALVKFAALCDLEIRWSPDTVISQAGLRGFGDNWLGAQYRFHHQTRRVPALAVSYAVKFPSASFLKGLGSGRVDHQIKFLASKDVRGTHFDFNASGLIVGEPFESKRDTSGELDLAFSHPIRGKLGLTGEIYGDTELNRWTPGYASTLWAFYYHLSPRLVVDAGMDTALTADAPFRKRFVVGFVYSLAELYPRLRRKH